MPQVPVSLLKMVGRKNSASTPRSWFSCVPLCQPCLPSPERFVPQIFMAIIDACEMLRAARDDIDRP